MVMCHITIFHSVTNHIHCITVVPCNYNGPEKFLSPSDIVALVVHMQHITHVCGDACVFHIGVR